MQTNSNKIFLNANQPAAIPCPPVGQQRQQQYYQQQVNTQAYIHNPQQYYAQQPQGPQYNPYEQYNPNFMVPFDIIQQNQYVQSPMHISPGITNKNSFMLRIIIIYILQYAAQLGLVFVFLLNKDLSASLFLIVFPLAIIIPIIAWNLKGLQTNSASVVIIVIYQVVYAAFLASLMTIGTHTKEKPREGHISFGDNFSIALIALINLLLNALGLIQLVFAFIIMQFKVDAFTMSQFKMVGSVISVMCGVPFIQVHVLAFAVVASTGVIFNLWFSSGLTKVLDERFGLQQNQVVFGSFAVFVFMACPCV